MSKYLVKGTEIFNGKIPRYEIMKDKVLIYSSSVAASTLTINTTWEALGKFKTLEVIFHRNDINADTTMYFAYEVLSSGNYLNQNANNINVYTGNFIGTSSFIIHLIPASQITSNSITFDSYDSGGYIKRLYVVY